MVAKADDGLSRMRVIGSVENTFWAFFVNMAKFPPQMKILMDMKVA